jgi:hypothetical protein
MTTRPRSVLAATFVIFAASLVVGAAITYGAVYVIIPAPKSPAATQPEASFTSDEVAAGFRVVTDPDEPGTPLGPPPSDQLIQLVSFDKDDLPGRLEAAPWWSLTPAGIPRVDHITQFDGGPLQGVNAVPAAGAMLARLAFGILTTASQLRSLEADQEGGSSLAGLIEALADRWDVPFSGGDLSSEDLRELLASGAGAVVALNYGDLPAAQRQQADYAGSHALYIDGFRAGSSTGAAEYYVMDPMGLPWQGYHGDWWPAEIVDRPALDFGGGSILAVWAFAGGVNPSAPGSGGSLELSIGDQPASPPPEASPLVVVEAVSGGLRIEPFLQFCLEAPTPAECPAGLPAIYQPRESDLAFLPPAGGAPLELFYVDAPQPGVVRPSVSTVIFSAPASDVEPTFSYWPADGSAPVGPVLQVEPVAVTLGGRQVWVVSVPIPQAGTYGFVAFGTSANGGVVHASEVGAISFGN